MKRWNSSGICAVLVFTVLPACGGTVTVSPSKGTPRDQLQSSGPERCKEACVTVTACGLGSKSCDCSCPPCAAGATSCECPACACTQESTTPEKCESDCNESLQQILKDKSDCDGPMLALLNCLAGADCQSGEPCQAEQDAMKGCSETHASPPPVGGSDPGSAVGPNGASGGGVGGGSSGSGTTTGSAAGGVTCLNASGTAGLSSSGGPLPPEGNTVCQTDWDSCSDGHSYGVSCIATTSAVMTCRCIVDGMAQVNFPATSCVESSGQAAAACGWNLL